MLRSSVPTAATQGRRQAPAERLRISQLAFPNNNNLPAKSAKPSCHSAVTRDILVKLGLPEGLATLWCVAKSAFVMAVPEAPMYKHNGLMRRQYDVRLAE